MTNDDEQLFNSDEELDTGEARTDTGLQQPILYTPSVKEDLRYGVPSKQAQDMGSTYDRRSGNFPLFLIEYQTYHTAI